MKKLFIFLGIVSALFAVTLTVTAFSNLVIIPIIIAFLSGLLIIFITKKDKVKTKTVQYIFLLTIIALGITIYKNVYHSLEDSKAEELQQLEEKTKEDTKINNDF